ncbi:hydroxyisourate hydrolase [Azospirillum rugosum]|uniref:hydroxyisourate hydrolase n=1 Tax=Azospirillum rugosum TaxID=416170 RepID=A0ABS4SUF1_9PROT|nr:hydroxyisourate hydrolase [Azospirillum rugosum]MBP2296189.1 5-hydroxyisourate hydrolase [Azospirillum rugosum]MDQ0527126.1 5-hydroxyisourate hydrolase [Azospirillum rugosum]
MAGGISVHAVDVARGVPAQGMRVELFALRDGGRALLAEGVLGANGALDHPVTAGQGVTAGAFEAVFHIGDYQRAAGVAVGSPAFLEEVPFRFTVTDVDQHYHLPLKFTPWGFSLFRGA